MDGYSHYVQVLLFQTKYLILNIVKRFIERIKVETKQKVNFFRSNRDRKYMAKYFQDYFKNEFTTKL